MSSAETGIKLEIKTSVLACHTVPVQRQLLPLEEYVCPSTGFKGKLSAIVITLVVDYQVNFGYLIFTA